MSKSPQRSCLGNKTEASARTITHVATPSRPQRSCLGNKTEALSGGIGVRPELPASTKLPR